MISPCLFASRAHHSYKQEDPQDVKFPTAAPRAGETPSEFFAPDEAHPDFPNERLPLTKLACDPKSRFWATFEADTGDIVTTRTGFWGDEYAYPDPPNLARRQAPSPAFTGASLQLVRQCLP